MEIKPSLVHLKVHERLKDLAWEGSIDIDVAKTILAVFRLKRKDYNCLFNEMIKLGLIKRTNRKIVII